MHKVLFPALLALVMISPCDAQPLTASDAKAREIFSKVIAYKTEVGQGQVPEMVKYLAGEFRAAGFPDADIHILPLGETASLVVRYRGDGTGGKPIALMAHMDVVTAKPEDWQRDPFKLVEENGYFFGRGTLDIKNGVTSLTATFLRLKSEGFVPTRDLIIVFTGDEETEQKTTADLVKNHRDLVDAEFALNTDAGGGSLDDGGKPTIYSIGTAEKTYASYEISTHNPGGHSSMPRADNAIYELADALKKIQAYRFPVMWNDTTLASFKSSGKVTAGQLGEAMRKFALNPHDNAAADVLFDSPEEVGKTRTTCVATLLRGGHAENALPQSATATINCRIFPGVAVADVTRTLQNVVGPAVSVTVIGAPTFSDASPLRADVMTAVTDAIHIRHPGIPVVPTMQSGASDGIYFRAAGIPTYGVNEDFIKDGDDFSHGLNERLPVKSFYEGLEYWYVLLKELSAPKPVP
jgi:acetylornithine deacetylase/succinyl-diaminopimelate desuccinylase-like protein